MSAGEQIALAHGAQRADGGGNPFAPATAGGVAAAVGGNQFARHNDAAGLQRRIEAAGHAEGYQAPTRRHRPALRAAASAAARPMPLTASNDPSPSCASSLKGVVPPRGIEGPNARASDASAATTPTPLNDGFRDSMGDSAPRQVAVRGQRPQRESRPNSRDSADKTPAENPAPCSWDGSTRSSACRVCNR